MERVKWFLRIQRFTIQLAAGRIDLLAPAHFGPSAWPHLCRSHPCGSIRRGGRVNDSPNQTTTVVRMELRGSAT